MTWVNTRTPLSKYDYGWLKEGGVDWAGAGAGYFGPPHSLWWGAVLPWILPIGAALLLAAKVFG